MTLHDTAALAGPGEGSTSSRATGARVGMTPNGKTVLLVEDNDYDVFLF